jgi:hypothetical protein
VAFTANLTIRVQESTAHPVDGVPMRDWNRFFSFWEGAAHIDLEAPGHAIQPI